jgi:hypothetical protein
MEGVSQLETILDEILDGVDINARPRPTAAVGPQIEPLPDRILPLARQLLLYSQKIFLVYVALSYHPYSYKETCVPSCRDAVFSGLSE